MATQYYSYCQFLLKWPILMYSSRIIFLLVAASVSSWLTIAVPFSFLLTLSQYYGIRSDRFSTCGLWFIDLFLALLLKKRENIYIVVCLFAPGFRLLLSLTRHSSRGRTTLCLSGAAAGICSCYLRLLFLECDICLWWAVTSLCMYFFFFI